MQTTHKISGDSAAGYAADLTSASDRGDYYTAGGEGETGTGTAMRRAAGTALRRCSPSSVLPPINRSLARISPL